MRSLESPDGAISAAEAASLFAMPGPRPERIVIGISGGPDSVALAGLYAETAGLAGLPEATLATVDHRLRQTSASEAEAVAAFAASLGLDHVILPWEGPKPEAGIQAAARQARYDLLAAHARKCGAGAILVAHTLDDQAETVLMRLLRGSGIKGLGGMERISLSHGLRLVRPLLDLPKSRLVATCKARHWPFVTDPSNSDSGFLRARLRAVAPVLAREGLTAERLVRLASRMRRADETLDSQALAAIETCRMWERGATLYDATRLAAVPDEILVRIFAHFITMSRDAADGRLPPRLERIEALAAEFRRAVAENRDFRRNAGGVLFTLRQGVLSLGAEPLRHARRLSETSDNVHPALGKAASDP